MSYLGTRESPPLRVVGSSSKMDEMSLPSGTETSVYMTFSWVVRSRARRASWSESSWDCRRNVLNRQAGPINSERPSKVWPTQGMVYAWQSKRGLTAIFMVSFISTKNNCGQLLSIVKIKVKLLRGL